MKKNSDKNKQLETEEDLIFLQDEMISTIEAVQVKEVDTEEEAKSMIQFLRESMAVKGDWSKRNEALTIALQYIKGGIYYFKQGDIQNLIKSIKGLLSDIRPITIKSTLIFLVGVSQIMKRESFQFLSEFIPLTMKLLTHQNIIVANCAHITLLQIAQTTVNPSLLKQILPFANTQDLAAKVTVAEMLHIAAETWPAKYLDESKSAMNDTLLKFSKDSDKLLAETANNAIKNLENVNSRPKTQKSTLALKFIPRKAKKTDHFSPPRKQKPQPKFTPKEKEQKQEFSDDDIIIKPKKQEEHTETAPEKSQETEAILDTEELAEESKTNIETEDLLEEEEDIVIEKHEKPKYSPQNVKTQPFEEEDGENQKIEDEKQQESKKQSNIPVKKAEEKPQNKFPLADVIIPSKPEEAEILAEILLHAISEGDFSEIDKCAEDLGTGLKFAMVFKQKYSHWPEIISALMEHYQEDLQPYLFEIFKASSFNAQIIEAAIKIYKGEKLIADLAALPRSEQNPAAFPFLCALTDINPNIDMTKPCPPPHGTCENFCNAVLGFNKLANKTPLISKFINDHIKKSSFTEELAQMIHLAKQGKSIADMIQPLLDIFDPENNAQEMSNMVSTDASVIYTDGTVQAQTAFLPLLASSRKFSNVVFSGFVEPIIKLMAADGCQWKEAGINAVIELLYDVKPMSTLFSIIDRAPSLRKISLEVLYGFFKKATPQRIVPIQKAVAQKLIPYSAASDDDVRNYVIGIFVEINKKIPTVFRKQISKMKPAVQRLVLMKTAKSEK